MTSITPRPPAFRSIAHDLGRDRNGTAVQLMPMSPAAAKILGPGLAAIEPWARVGFPAATMTAFLAASEAGAVRYQITVGDVAAGVLVIRHPWLHGPYLQLIGLLPPFHRRGIGEQALDWIESEARGRFRNLWLCVSAFNTDARRLYERQGYTLAGRLDDLVYEGLDELLMRKRLFA